MDTERSHADSLVTLYRISCLLRIKANVMTEWWLRNWLSDIRCHKISKQKERTTSSTCYKLETLICFYC